MLAWPFLAALLLLSAAESEQLCLEDVAVSSSEALRAWRRRDGIKFDNNRQQTENNRRLLESSIHPLCPRLFIQHGESSGEFLILVDLLFQLRRVRNRKSRHNDEVSFTLFLHNTNILPPCRHPFLYHSSGHLCPEWADEQNVCLLIPMVKSVQQT